MANPCGRACSRASVHVCIHARDDLLPNFYHVSALTLTLQSTHTCHSQVWLPDEQWGRVAMPPCVSCRSASCVGIHGWRDKHFGRRVCSLTTHYFIISRRYICHSCETKTKEIKEAARGVGLHVVQDTRDSPPAYTFMGYDARSRQRLPQGKGADFPAFLTHKGAVDMLLVDLMRPFYDKGVRPEVCVCCHCVCLCLCLRLRLCVCVCV